MSLVNKNTRMKLRRRIGMHHITHAGVCFGGPLVRAFRPPLANAHVVVKVFSRGRSWSFPRCRHLYTSSCDSQFAVEANHSPLVAAAPLEMLFNIAASPRGSTLLALSTLPSMLTDACPSTLLAPTALSHMLTDAFPPHSLQRYITIF